MEINRRKAMLGLAGIAGAGALYASTRREGGFDYDMNMEPWAKTAPPLRNYRRGARPNILLIMSDQERARRDLPLGLDLPNHRRLLDRSTEFGNYHVVNTPCSPSRSTIYTGEHTKFTQVLGNPGIAGAKYLDPQMATIGDMLREQGYYTAYKGKWHLAPLYADTSKMRDRAAGPQIYPAMDNAMEQYGFSDFLTYGDRWGGGWDGYRFDQEIASEAGKWLRERAPVVGADRPWMLAVNFINPHDIMFYAASEKQVNSRSIPNMLSPLRTDPVSGPYLTENRPELPASLADDLSSKPWLQRCYRELNSLVFGEIGRDERPAWSRFLNYYYNCLRDVDQSLGTVLDALEESGEAENTVVIYTSDHGEMAGSHGLREKGPFVYRENVRVPLIVSMPGQKEARSTDALASSIDLVPTLLSLAGVDERQRASRYPRLKGFDLLPSVDGYATGRQQRGMLFYFSQVVWLDPELSRIALEHSNSSLDAMVALAQAGYIPPKPRSGLRNQGRGIFDGRYKFARYFPINGFNRPDTLEALLAHNDLELYDTLRDPDEINNLAQHPQQHRAVIERLSRQMNVGFDAELGAKDDGSELDGAHQL